MTELKPCPFCGGEASPNGKVRYSPSYEGTWADGSKVTDAFFVNCIKCGADNRAHLGHQTKAQAIAAWNTRASDKEVEEWKQNFIAFAGPAAAHYARTFDLPDGHLHPQHYDLLKRAGARMDSFTRAEIGETHDN